MFVRATYATSAVGAIISPTSGNKPASVARLVSAAACGEAFNGGRTDPSSTSFVDPPGLPALLPAGSATDGESELVTSLALTAAVAVASTLVSIAYARASVGASSNSVIASSLATAFVAVGLTYLGPNVVQYAATLLAHGATAAASPVAAGCIVAVVGPMVAACWVCWPSPPVAGDAPPSLRDVLRGGVWSAFHHGSRDGSVLKLRLYVFEDLAVAVGLAALSGVHPSTAAGCRAVAASMLALGLVHLCYVVGVRPQQGRLELAFAVANAVVVGAVGLAVVLIVFLEWHGAVAPLGYLLTGVDGLVLVQVVVLGAFGLKQGCAERSRGGAADGRAAADAGDASVAPLLVVPAGMLEPMDRRPAHNPLNAI